MGVWVEREGEEIAEEKELGREVLGSGFEWTVI